MRLIDAILDLLFPPKCLFCQRLLQEDEHIFCAACAREAMQLEQPQRQGEFFTDCVAVYPYAGVVRDAIRRYKFQGAAYAAGAYGMLLAARIRSSVGAFDTMTWVPLSPRRRRQRGYDQTELLCRAAAKQLGCPLEPLLRKTVDNPAQSGIGGLAARRANVLGVFAPLHPERIAGKRILLVDDIVTTGATLSECSRVLRTAGAREVVCAALAATPKMEWKDNDVQTDQ